MLWVLHVRRTRVWIEERVRNKLSRMERDDDEVLKNIAEIAYGQGGYAFDII